MLFKRTHETMSRFDVLSDLRVVDLEQEAQLSCYWISDFRHLCNGWKVLADPEIDI